MFEVVSPRAAALRILASRYARDDSSATSHNYSLAGFQQEAVARARTIMRARGGVILADSVGLGKTFVAAALIELALAAEQRCVVVVPAAMRGVWARELRPLIQPAPHLISILSHGDLSRGRVFNGGFVVVDEAHAFRSPQTRRYRALRRSCYGSQVLLLTATPINNSLTDLYFQLRLFAADNAFHDIGIGSLAGLLNGPETDADALQRLRRAVMIRRTRSELRSRFQHIELLSGEQLRFPGAVHLTTIGYPIGSVSIKEIGSQLEQVRFTPYGHQVTAILLRLSLLKRLQSSVVALRMSLDRLISFYDRYIASLDVGRVLKPRLLRDVAGEQLVLAELLVEESSTQTSITDLKCDAQQDVQTLRSLRDAIMLTRDEKLATLVELLRSRDKAKTLVFTEFVDTAQDLWRALHREFRVALVTGTSAFLGANVSSRAEVIRRFAPHSNAAPDPPTHEAVDVLIATDVLAEGLNLQDADAVVSYDLPWNPVRLIQRSGRVDRIGSPHYVVNVFNFIPDREFDDWLGLMRSLRLKVVQMRKAVGQETAVVEPDELDVEFLASLQTGGSGLLEEEPRDSRFHEPLQHLEDAAPPGCVAALPGSQRRVLVCWSRGHETRGVVVIDDAVSADGKLADEILERALEQTVGQSFNAESSIERARQYLEEEFAFGRPQPNRLANEITNAVHRLGVLITDEALKDAELTLQMVQGYLGKARDDCVRLRAATNVEKLREGLCEIRLSCTPQLAQETPLLSLIAAIASD